MAPTCQPSIVEIWNKICIREGHLSNFLSVSFFLKALFLCKHYGRLIRGNSRWK